MCCVWFWVGTGVKVGGKEMHRSANMDWEWRVGWAVRRAELSGLPCYKSLAKC